MHHLPRRWTRSAVWMLTCALTTGGCAAQTWYPPPPVAAPMTPASPPPAQLPTPARLMAPQLEQLLAPVALYPDPLLANVLAAATYPLDVAEAAQWLREPGNAGLAGEALSNALVPLPWDASVKSLVPFPEVLRLLGDNRAWTEQLGGAFIVQQSEVMDAVQTLRQRASQSGNLRSTPQAYVQTQGQTIIIEPPTPEYVYVPVYDPRVVYGHWPYSDYPPRHFSGYFGGATYFGTGVTIGWFGLAFEQERWRWNRWDWGGRRLVVYRDRYERYGHHHGRHHHFDDGYWRHDPDWRGRRDRDDRWRDGPRDRAPDRRRPTDAGVNRPRTRDGEPGNSRFPGPVPDGQRENRGKGRFPGSVVDAMGTRDDPATSPQDRGGRGPRGGAGPAPDVRGGQGPQPPSVGLPGVPPRAATPAAPSPWPADGGPEAVINRGPYRGPARFPTLPVAPMGPTGEQAGPVQTPPQATPIPFAREARPGYPASPSAPPASRFQAPPSMEDRRMPEPRVQMPVERPMPRAMPQPMPEMRPPPASRFQAPPSMHERQERFQPRQVERGGQQERTERRERRQDERRERN